MKAHVIRSLKPTFAEPPQQVLIDSNGEGLIGELFRVPGPGPHPTALLLNGIPGTRAGLLYLGVGLQSIGWNALHFSYMGMWGSAGRFSFAQLLPDGRAAAAFLASDPRVDRTRMAAVGYSNGGWVAAWLAAEDPSFRRLVLVQPLVDPDRLNGRFTRGELALPPPRDRLLEAGLGGGYLDAFHADRGRPSALEAAARLRDRGS